jgi:hypothetical protein
MIALLVALTSAPSAFAPAFAGEEGGELWLIRAARESRDDLARLLAAGFPVVYETRDALLIEGDPAELQRLREAGFAARLIDTRAGDSDYVAAGIRPDSDTGALTEIGAIVHEEANWLLVRLPRGAALSALAGARLFLTRLAHEPLEPPQSRRPRGRARAEQAGSNAGSDLLDEGGADPLVQKIVDSVLPADIDQLWQDLTTNSPSGTRFSTSQGCRDAASYCAEHYGALGLPHEYQDWSASHAPNVIATQLGALYPDDVYIIEGHLDDLPSTGAAPGADDNASGSVTVLEAAKVLACYGLKSTVKYLNVTGEEQGLLGSDAYADDAFLRGENVLGVINMDMNGWEGDGLPGPENLDINYNGPSEWLGLKFAECAEKYGTGLAVDAFYCPSLTASDHYPFWQKGWSAICGITDNEGYCGHGGNYPYYHQSTDTIENCGDPSFFYAAVKASAATLAELAEPFKITFDRSHYGCEASVRLLVADRDVNSSPELIESVEIEVWSDSELDPEIVTLVERSPDSMVFEATLQTTPSPAVAGDGVLSVGEGDLLGGRYVDLLDCDGAPDVVYTATAVVDCQQPLISMVGTENVTDSAATIVWTTDEAASSLAHWGDTSPPNQTEQSPGLTSSHAVPLMGLQPCTTYYFSVESADIAGNVAVDNNGGASHRFETYGDFGAGLQPCRAGRTSFDAATYACSGLASVSVTDVDLNRDPLVTETAELELTSTTETDPLVVVVTETGPDTASFGGSVSLAPGAAAADHLLQVGHGDVLTVTYRDRDDGTGAAAISYDTSVADCAGPQIRDLRVTGLTDQRMTVSFDTDEPGTTTIEWGDTPALGQSISDPALTTSHVVVVNSLTMCQRVYLRVSSSDARGNVAVLDLAGEPFATHTWNIPGLYWRETFEGDVSGWTLEGEWQVDTPQGLGGAYGGADPSSAYNNLRALGSDLTGIGDYPGDYEHSSLERATSPSMDASAWTSTKLLLYRQLNVREDDVAGIAVMTRNKENLVYDNGGLAVSGGDYGLFEHDVSGIVDGKPAVSVRLFIDSDGQDPFLDDGVSSGWNVDDVILKDGTQPDYAACGGCVTAPAFGGAARAADDDACNAGGVTVSWDAAASWGSGGAGSYSVYRATSPGFTPSPETLVASGVVSTSWTDSSPPPDVPLHYIVRAENDETCGAGPANGGLVDGNAVAVAATETSSRPLPQEIGRADVALVGGAHVRLEWSPADGAERYRVVRSPAPDSGFVTLAETAASVYEDLSQGANSNTWFYLVRGVNACGEAGP